MEINQAEEWQRLTEHYRGMLDGELEQLGESFGDLTEAAQQVLRNELSSRGLDAQGSAKKAPRYKAPPSRFAGSLEPGAGTMGSNAGLGDADDPQTKEFTWKTPLCDCESNGQAWEIHQALTRAGIDSWIEYPGRDRVSVLRIVVAEDQLEEAQEIAARPIPQELIDDYNREVPEYVAPTCPKCGAEDPVLESAEPTNEWLCEACGAQWSEQEADSDESSEKAGR